MERLHQRINIIIGLAVFAIAFTMFYLTAAPTVAFWDCGEYTAAGHSLGIPHPPGNPFFMILLRVSSILFSFFHDVGYRLNFFVVLTSALTALVMYFTTVRVATLFTGIPDTLWKQLVVYVGGVVGGLFSVAGSTFWFSAVEASEANPAMLFVALSTWLTLVWAQSKDPKRDRYLLLLTYISFLGIGVHMYSMIVLPPIFLFVLIVDESKRKDWRVWATCVALGIVIKDLPMFIYLAPIALLVTMVMSMAQGKNQAKWQFCFLLTLVAILGFSTHLYIPIRSALGPMINENDPSNWIAFKEFLERKQYGSEDMFTRMFWRRGSFANQFGIEGHMGYGGFHLTQFFKFDSTDTERSLFASGFEVGLGKLIVYLLPTLFMLYGWYYLAKRNRSTAIYLVVLFIVCSIFLTLYMNFADGTRPEYRDYQNWVQYGKQGPLDPVHREVRVRDYFWAAAFMYFGMWMGIAASALMYVLFTNKNKLARTTLAPIVVILLAVSPALPISQNWGSSTRKNDWIPFDYAYNLLMSCEKDGILFTNGDNDTFPLWALQEAYGIRKDVRIVNLSLVNTNWYIKQLKHYEPKVPISFTDQQIDRLNHELNPLAQPTTYKMDNAGITVVVPGREQLNALRVQDKMVLNIVDSNRWRKPIYFAITVSDDNFMGLGPYLQMEGMAYRILPQQVAESDRINIPRTLHLLDNVYQYRGLGDGSTRLNYTSEKLLSNYAANFIQVCLQLRGPLMEMKSKIESLKLQKESNPAQNELSELEKAYQDTLNIVLTKADQCVSLIPHDWRGRTLRHEILMSHGLYARAEAAMQEAIKVDPTNDDYKKMLAQALEKQGKQSQANAVFKDLLGSDTDPWLTYMSIAQNYSQIGKNDSAKLIMEQYKQNYPGDKRAQDLINHYDSLSKKDSKAN